MLIFEAIIGGFLDMKDHLGRTLLQLFGIILGAGSIVVLGYLTFFMVTKCTKEERERMMLAHVYLKKGCVVPRHQHENEQLTYILEGALRFKIGPEGSEVITVRAGEVLVIPSNVPHEAEALEDTLDVDVFDLDRRSESGAAKHVEQVDLREARQDDITLWRQYEANLFQVFKQVVERRHERKSSRDRWGAL